MQPWQLLQHALQTATAITEPTSVPRALSTLEKTTSFPSFSFSEQWQLLGPFQIGTREASWGADPLEQYGGFRNLTFDDHSRFPSSLPFNATTSWSNVTAKLGRPNVRFASAELSVGYRDVDWTLLQQVYGWAALQWQGWARGEIAVQSDEPVTLALHAEDIIEFWVDEKHYFGGDFYGFGRAPTVLHLKPGTHRVDVRLVRDVRSMGGITENPTIDVNFKLQVSHGDVRQSGELLMADRIEGAAGLLASDLGSVVLRNDRHEDIRIESIRPRPQFRNVCETILVHNNTIKIAPGQSRPIAFRVAFLPGTPLFRSIDLEVSYHLASKEHEKLLVWVSSSPRSVRKHEPQKFTYLHPGGMVSYAVLRPPSSSALESCETTNGKLPVLLALHGAGLEADDDLVRHALDPLADLCAWVLFPTGVTPWSGDDWHTWGSADVEAAVNAIPDWIEHNSWTGPGVDTDRWLVVGHSNGGQGTWHILTHCPDKVIAAAPLSGYSSIQNYVPYHFWHMADPRKTPVVQASLGSYRHELLLGNTKDIPILQQHGSADDNVPAYHSRLMHQLLPESESGSTYHEVEGKPHYWDGVMTTQPLSEFLEHHLTQAAKQDGNSTKIYRPFTLTTINPADTGSLHGICILGLTVPGQLGRVEVLLEGPHAYTLYTSNVRALEFSAHIFDRDTISIDDQVVNLKRGDDITLIKLIYEGMWIVSDSKPNNRRLPKIRTGRQLGSVDSILRTNGAFQIIRHPSKYHEAVDRVALQISRNLCQYFSADTELAANMSEAVNNRTGSVISVYLGTHVPPTPYSMGAVTHGISVDRGRVEVTDVKGSKHVYRSRGKGLAAIYLRHLPDERLELVVWGVDEASLRTAARLVPMMTGVGVPDFVVADSTMLWKGVDGALALGFLDENWQASSNAMFT